MQNTLPNSDLNAADTANTRQVSQATPYELLGGAVGVRRLVQRFYFLMDDLPEAYSVRKMHPSDLTGSEEKLFEFLTGWLGGPDLYVQKRGHPRLRMRHNPYAVGAAQRDEWMMCMEQALTEQVADVPFRQQLINAFTRLADHMVNTPSGGAH